MTTSDIAEFLSKNKRELARRASELYFERHPAFREWESGVKHTLEDTAYTLEFLASAIEVNSREAFTEYIAWLYTILKSRNLDMTMLTESLEDIRQVLSEEAAEVSAAANPMLEAGLLCVARKNRENA